MCAWSNRPAQRSLAGRRCAEPCAETAAHELSCPSIGCAWAQTCLLGECRDAENVGIVVWYLLLGGANAVLYNIVHYRVIQITSSTATPVIGGTLFCFQHLEHARCQASMEATSLMTCSVLELLI